MKKSKLALVSIVLSTIAATASAQNVASTWYVAPTVSAVITSPHREDRVGSAVGMTVGKVLTDRWNVELGSQYSMFGAHDNQLNVGVDSLFFFQRNPLFSPFATLGLGYVYEGPLPDEGHGTYERLMLRGGLGFTTNITKNVDFRMDARYQWHGGRSGASGLGDWFISTGLNFYF
jgi:hypothetical protein